MSTIVRKYKTRTLAALLAPGLVLCLLPHVSAQEAPPDDETTTAAANPEAKPAAEPGRNRPHKGVFFRLSVGAGFGWFFADGRSPPKPGLHTLDDPEHMSLLIGGLISLGGYVVENWGLHFDMAYQGMPIKKTEPTNQEYGTFSAGLGLTHYFMPVNLYLTGSVRWARVLMRLDEAVVCWLTDQFHTYDGIGGFLTFGKEWFGKRTGFGLGLELGYARTFSESQDFNVLGAMLVFTLTAR